MIKDYKKYYKLLVILFLTILSFLYMKKDNPTHYEISTLSSLDDVEIDKDLQNPNLLEEKEKKVEESVLEIKKVPVYVCGQVNNPDVYYLYETAIVKDAIWAAGGFSDDANIDAWNLAMQIEKGIKIDVPKVGEEIDKTNNSYDNSNRDINISSGLININKADIMDLTTLPGIGPVTAQNIINYRSSNGEFKSLEDVNNVPRIGRITLEKIQDYICFQ